MARTLTPEEWAELLRAQREGGIPNVAPDRSMRFEGRPIQQPRVEEPRTSLLQTLSQGAGRVKDWVGGLVTPQTRSGSVEAPRPSGSLMDLKPQLGVQEEIPVDQLYQAIINSEHRNEVDRLNPWIQNREGSSAWGPVQILKDTMEEARRVGNLTAEESDYVDRYKTDQQTVDPNDKVLYTSIAKKLLQYYMDKYQDPLKVADVWRYGERGSRTQSVVNDDKPYWEEFRKVMGL
jgi:hypothetical protein